jgi:hypothetical protein
MNGLEKWKKQWTVLGVFLFPYEASYVQLQESTFLYFEILQ